jgi:hypothetical protein
VPMAPEAVPAPPDSGAAVRAVVEAQSSSSSRARVPASPVAAEPTSRKGCWRTPSPSREFYVSTLVQKNQVGREALQSFCRAVDEQLEWMRQNPIRHGRGTKRSIPIEERCGMLAGFQEHGGRQPVEQGHRMGDLLGLLWQVLLQQLKEKEYLPRCGASVPRKATDPRKFHSLHYRSFLKAHPRWGEYTATEQSEALRQFLFDYWTTDKLNEVMRPELTTRRKLCRASWGEFWLTDMELDELVSDVVREYRDGADRVLQS